MTFENRCAPLQEVSSYDPSFQVESRLSQTHWKFFHTENDIKLEIISLCCQLELLCKKSYCKSKDMNELNKMEFSNKFIPHACVELKKINERFSLLPHQNASLEDYMMKHQMHLLFPKVWWYLQDSDEPLHSPKPILHNYFERLATLNQLNMMSQQIHFDLHNLVNHKYMAHQTALLYHAIADLGPFVKRYKKAVEDSFSDIKSALTIEDDQIPHLSNNEKQRLDTMTRRLMELSTCFDNELFDPLTPIGNFFCR